LGCISWINQAGCISWVNQAGGISWVNQAGGLSEGLSHESPPRVDRQKHMSCACWQQPLTAIHIKAIIIGNQMARDRTSEMGWGAYTYSPVHKRWLHFVVRLTSSCGGRQTL